MKRFLVILLAFVVAVSMFAGCGGAGTNPGTGGQGGKEPPADINSETPLRIQWNQSIGVDTLFEGPHINSSLMLATPMIWDTLGYYDAVNATWRNALAKEYGSNENHTEWWITLKDGLKWHDGEDVTIEDLYFTIHNAILNPNSMVYTSWQDVEGYREQREIVDGTQDTIENSKIEGITIDGDKLVIKLTASRPGFFSNMLNTYLLPAHLLSDLPWADVDTCDYWKKPVGCGPYKINEVKFPDYFTMTRYEDYWGEPAGIKNVHCVNYTTGGNDAAVAAIINGEIDFANRTTITDRSIGDSIAAQNPNVKILSMPGYGMRYFMFNTNRRQDGKLKADLKKKEVRQAFDLLLDQETIAYFAQSTPSNTLVSSVAYDYNSDLVRPSKDVAAAKKLLDAAGFDYSQTYDILYYYTDQTTHDIMAMIKQDFAEAGVKIEYKCYTDNLNDVIYKQSNFDLIYAYSVASSEYPAAIMATLRSSSTYKFIGMENDRKKLIDPLYSRYQATIDPMELSEISKELQAVNFEHCYALPCYSLTTYCAYNTARVYIPADVFSVDGNTYYQFNNWRVID